MDIIVLVLNVGQRCVAGSSILDFAFHSLCNLQRSSLGCNHICKTRATTYLRLSNKKVSGSCSHQSAPDPCILTSPSRKRRKHQRFATCIDKSNTCQGGSYVDADNSKLRHRMKPIRSKQMLSSTHNSFIARAWRHLRPTMVLRGIE